MAGLQSSIKVTPVEIILENRREISIQHLSARSVVRTKKRNAIEHDLGGIRRQSHNVGCSAALSLEM